MDRMNSRAMCMSISVERFRCASFRCEVIQPGSLSLLSCRWYRLSANTCAAERLPTSKKSCWHLSGADCWQHEGWVGPEQVSVTKFCMAQPASKEKKCTQP